MEVAGAGVVGSLVGERRDGFWTVVALEERRGPVVEGKGKGRKGEEEGEEKQKGGGIRWWLKC